MAASNLVDTNIHLVYDAGIDEKGDMIAKRKSYNNIKPEATADEIYLAAQALASLSSLPLFTIERSDKTEILG